MRWTINEGLNKLFMNYYSQSPRKNIEKDVDKSETWLGTNIQERVKEYEHSLV